MRYGLLAPFVIDHARHGDRVAMPLVQRMVDDLGRYIARLRAFGADKICLAGGLAAPLSQWLPSETARHLQAPEQDATDGAIQLAKGAANGLAKTEPVA